MGGMGGMGGDEDDSYDVTKDGPSLFREESGDAVDLDGSHYQSGGLSPSSSFSVARGPLPFSPAMSMPSPAGRFDGKGGMVGGGGAGGGTRGGNDASMGGGGGGSKTLSTLGAFSFASTPGKGRPGAQ